MKQIYKRTMLWASLLLAFNTNAQIDSLVVIPASPNITDTVSVIAYTTFGTGGCLQTGSQVIQGSPIKVKACHENGILTVICSTVDTIKLGVLGAGTHMIDYLVRRENNASLPPSCNGSVVLDSLRVNLTIGTVGIGESSSVKNQIDLYPNPSTGQITIELKAITTGAESLIINNIVGQKVAEVKLEEATRKTSIDLSFLNPGTYIYQLVAKDGSKGPAKKLVLY